MILLFANIVTFTAALIFFGFSIVYFFKSKSVKNHCSTLQKNLKEATEENRILIFALMRGAGGGALSVAVLIAWLQLQYSRHSFPSVPLQIVIVGVLFYLSSLNGMVLVKRNTKIKPPVFLLSFAMILIIIGYFLNIEIANQ